MCNSLREAETGKEWARMVLYGFIMTTSIRRDSGAGCDMLYGVNSRRCTVLRLVQQAGYVKVIMIVLNSYNSLRKG